MPHQKMRNFWFDDGILRPQTFRVVPLRYFCEERPTSPHRLIQICKNFVTIKNGQNLSFRSFDHRKLLVRQNHSIEFTLTPEFFLPMITPAIFDLRPDYCALSVMALNVTNSPSDALSMEVAEVLRSPTPAWAEAHLDAWREAYRGFGAKPQRTLPSADALIQRFRRDGQLPPINPVVDLYNAISVSFAVPVGGENMAAYVSSPLLARADGSELFDTTKDGAPYLEPVPAGEVVWKDDQGVTCRRWNWRQGLRTRIESSTTDMWFVLERLDPMPMDSLHEAGRVLIHYLRALSPEAHIRTFLSDRSGTTAVP